MGRKEKKTNSSTSLVAGSCYEDLSLTILQKALLLRSLNSKSERKKRKKKKMKMKKKKKEKEKEKKKLESEDQSAVIIEEEEAVETIKATEEKKPAEAGKVQMSNNVVLRKLLRGPRYFDPPTDSGWGTCYNCGEEGHAAVNCIVAKHKKPCFVCGSLGHSVKQCTKARDCFICKKGGHHAKDCPEKHKGGSKSSKICLKCGNYGHEMFSCKYDYSPDDIKEIQCYVCKRFGHLCCVNTTDTTLREISCYKCGQLGHTGLACSRLQTETTDSATPTSCHKCGEEGHFAQECSSFVKACSRFRTETTGAAAPNSCYKCGEQGHWDRECSSFVKVGKRKHELSNMKILTSRIENDFMGHVSAPHDVGKARKMKRPLTEERCITTPQKSKYIGGWMIEHPGEFSHLKFNGNSWQSPVILSSKSTTIYSFSRVNYTPSSVYSKMTNFIGGTPYSRGSVNAFDHRFPASRFGNFGSDGFGRSYNWW